MQEVKGKQINGDVKSSDRDSHIRRPVSVSPKTGETGDAWRRGYTDVEGYAHPLPKLSLARRPSLNLNQGRD